MYAGQADWTTIARLVRELDGSGVPVLGNGDVWTAADAMRLVDETGAAGVVVGRGCLGRPWLFGQLAAAFAGAPVPADPDLPVVLATLRRHAQLLVDDYGEERGCRDIRKHMAWYLKGYTVRQPVRQALGMVESLAGLDDLLAQIEPDQRADPQVQGAPRGRTSGNRRPTLPDRWLESPTLQECDRAFLASAELNVSGG